MATVVARQALLAYASTHRNVPATALQAGLEHCRAKQWAGAFWSATVDADNALLLRAATKARRAQRQAFGKRILFSTRVDMTARDILTTSRAASAIRRARPARLR